MRAVVLEQYGGPEVLTIRDIPAPEPGPEDVVVDVVGTALNRADLLQRAGLYPGPKMDHEVPGLEFAGRVRSVGARVAQTEIGAEVMGIVGGGAYAEQVVAHERTLQPVPSSVGVADAAAIPEVWMTAYDALVLQGGLTSGRTALVHAGASGVGTAAIQIAKFIGAEIVVTTSSAKVDRCRELGADVVVDYTSDDFADAVADHTKGVGVDVVLDVIGGEYLDRNIDSLKVKGRIIQVGVMGEGSAKLSIAKLLPKRASLTGTVLRSRPIEEKIEVNQRFCAEILPGFDRGALAPVIDTRYPFDQIADAHTYLATNASVGKVLIDVQ